MKEGDFFKLNEIMRPVVRSTCRGGKVLMVGVDGDGAGELQGAVVSPAQHRHRHLLRRNKEQLLLIKPMNLHSSAHVSSGTFRCALGLSCPVCVAANYSK